MAQLFLNAIKYQQHLQAAYHSSCRCKPRMFEYFNVSFLDDESLLSTGAFRVRIISMLMAESVGPITGARN